MRVVVVGTLASNPYAGMAWMHMQIVLGLLKLGHQAYYFETTSAWPFDPDRNARVCDSDHALPYLRGVAEWFGVGDRWAYRRSFDDKEWFGLRRREGEELLANADLVFNVAGATRFAEEGLEVGYPIYFGTDPVIHEVGWRSGNEETQVIMEEHAATVTYGENIGTKESPVPPLPNLKARTRQPTVIELWEGDAPARKTFTTVGNWRQEGRDIDFQGEIYRWSKHHEFKKVLDLPRRTEGELELALNLADPETIRHGEGEVVRAQGMSPEVQAELCSLGWNLVEARDFTRRPEPYREYIRRSAGEFTVARDLNVRLRSGWFSERSAGYLAAGRPVITQDTGFGAVLPTGEGLFSFDDLDGAVGAVEAVRSDYPRHSRAATDIAEEYFRAETVLQRLIDAL